MRHACQILVRSHRRTDQRGPCPRVKVGLVLITRCLRPTPTAAGQNRHAGGRGTRRVHGRTAPPTRASTCDVVPGTSTTSKGPSPPPRGKRCGRRRCARIEPPRPCPHSLARRRSRVRVPSLPGARVNPVRVCAAPYASRARDYRGVAEASEHGADISPMAHPRTHPGFPARGRVGVPTAGDADDFGRLVHLIASGDPTRGAPRSVRVLWAIR